MWRSLYEIRITILVENTKYEPIHTTNDWEVHFILPRQVIENEDDIIEYLQH